MIHIITFWFATTLFRDYAEINWPAATKMEIFWKIKYKETFDDMFAARNIRSNEWRLSRKFLDETQIKNLVRYIYLVEIFFIPSWNMSICKIMPMCIKCDRRFQKKQAVNSSKQENWIINRSILFYFSIKLFMYINWLWKTST